MNNLFILVYSSWFLSELLLNRLMHSKADDRQNTDQGSLSLIWITIMISISIAVVVSNLYYWPIRKGILIQYVGLIVIIAGMVLRLTVIASLGSFFTVDVTIRENHTLKKDGFYRYLRHPSYFASLLSFVGFGLSLNNWISFLIVVVAIVGAFRYRIKVEEQALINQFGQDYLDYKKSTKGLIPFLF
ncbi:MAG: isoprenylcysteine carboxylmethyltransferase family protein [Siphonobacter sp.]